jgi:hypothetical protein
MSRWFRFYDEVLNDPKVQLLPGDKFKTWVNLLCLASENGGSLPILSQIAFALRISESEAAAIVGEFCEITLLDTDKTQRPARYSPHNWNGRQFKSDVTDPTAALRQKAYRKRNADRNAAVTITATRVREQITESEKKEEDGAKAPIVDLFPKATAPPSEEKSYFDRAKEILGPSANGLAAKLKNEMRKRGKPLSDARAAIEMAASKSDAKAYLGAIIRGQDQGESGPAPGYGDDHW